MEFSVFKKAVAVQFERMQQHTLFRVGIDKSTLWETYLASFPEGSNQMYRKRTEHDCSCCRQFIKAVGDVVAVIDGKVVSVWDAVLPPDAPAYTVVAKKMAALVKDRPIADHFLHYENHAGTDHTFEELVDATKRWNHFHVNLKPRFVIGKAALPTQLSLLRSTRDVYYRSLKELTLDAAETVLDLIKQGSLYRGEEHKATVQTFIKAKKEFDALPDEAQQLMAWTAEATGPVSRIRNTAIGTLLIDLSEGTDLEAAVRKFESVVAPSNYKRPVALVTKAMIEKAKEQLSYLGLTSALERRYATMRDIPINDILFADRSARKVINNDVFDDMATAVPSSSRSMEKVDEVSIDKFITDILPRAESIEVMFQNEHSGNLFSLITAVDPTSGQLFKWNNKFSWTYTGDVADSMKERVKKAGGNVTGDLCCRLAWHNFDDLDFWMTEPNGVSIYFGVKVSGYTGGCLDVDMNAGRGHTREPVENIYYGERRRMTEGRYELKVNQFCRRDDTDPGFECEIDYLGTVYRFAYPKKLRDKETVSVATIDYSHKDGVKIVKSLPFQESNRTLWGISTGVFHRVNMVMLSPNYWSDQAVGNKHYFFTLDGCKNDGTARGFYNEFLSTALDSHRKVFEIVGARMKAEADDNQLSGLGFSSTQRATLLCRVKGSFNRVIKIVF